MMPTTFYTLSVPVANSNTSPAVVTTATDKPMRVLMSNTGGIAVYVAGATSDLQVAGGAVTSVFSLPAGDHQVFIIAPRQTIYVAGVGAGGEVSVSVSEAFPVP